MFNNPELKRNIWLEINGHKLVIIPVVIILILTVTWLTTSRFGEAFFNNAFWIYVVLVIGWGSKQAGDAIPTEVSERTWDSQRMSALSPWTMTTGKLFGSTIVAWYDFAFLLLAMIISFPGNSDSFHGMSMPGFFITLVLTAVLAHSLGLLASLVTLHKRVPQSRSLSTAYILLSLWAAAYTLTGAMKAKNFDTTWYGILFDGEIFVITSTIIFTFWCILGCYRLMRIELQLNNTPLYWTLFVIFLAVYGAGFVSPKATGSHYGPAVSVVAYTIIIMLTYLIAFADNKDPIKFRRLFHNFRQRNWQKVLQNIPAWLVSLVLLLIIGLILVWQTGNFWILQRFKIDMSTYITAIYLFALRDIGLIVYFNISDNRKRADMTAFMYMILLYFLIPFAFKSAGLTALSSLFHPFDAGHTNLTIISALVQCGIIAWLIQARWRRFF